MKPNKPQNKCQPKGIISKEEYMKKDRMDELLMDAIGGIEKEDECLHTPDLLEYFDTEDKGDQIHQIYQCKCGKEITEIFTLFNTKVSE